MSDNSAKVLSITAVWVCTACMFIFGIFDFNWSGLTACLLMIVISLGICFSAGYATKIICKTYENTKEKGANS